jgi:hypothetical protein
MASSVMCGVTARRRCGVLAFSIRPIARPVIA